MIKQIITTCLLAIFFASIGFAQRTVPTPERTAAWQIFKDQQGDNWEVEWRVRGNNSFLLDQSSDQIIEVNLNKPSGLPTWSFASNIICIWSWNSKNGNFEYGEFNFIEVSNSLKEQTITKTKINKKPINDFDWFYIFN